MYWGIQATIKGKLEENKSYMNIFLDFRQKQRLKFLRTLILSFPLGCLILTFSFWVGIEISLSVVSLPTEKICGSQKRPPFTQTSQSQGPVAFSDQVKSLTCISHQVGVVASQEPGSTWPNNPLRSFLISLSLLSPWATSSGDKTVFGGFLRSSTEGTALCSQEL